MSRTFQKILVPVDFSPYATEAVQYAHSIAQHFGASLLVLHVIAHEVEQAVTNYHLGRRGLPLLGPFAAPPEVPVDITNTVVIDLREQALVALQHFLPSELLGIVVEPRVVVGDPAVQILHLAQQEAVDLIVMGTHGRTGLAHMVFGSVAEHVVRQAPCPVLTVKAPVAPTA
jgi:universal stress protein A